MHGPAVASIAVGKNTGVAPEATLYYIGENFVTIDTEDHSPLASALNQLLDLNKNLPTANKIRVISISWGNENKNRKGYDEYMSALARAKEEGVFVLTTSLEQREGFQLNGLGKNLLQMLMTLIVISLVGGILNIHLIDFLLLWIIAV